MFKKRCCDVSGPEFLEVEGRKVGLLGLHQAFADVAKLGLSDDEEIANNLLALIASRNWIPKESQEAYRRALLWEYRRWQAQKENHASVRLSAG